MASDNYFVPVFASRPPSGLRISLPEDSYKKIKDYFGFETVFNQVGMDLHEGRASVLFTMSRQPIPGFEYTRGITRSSVSASEPHQIVFSQKELLKEMDDYNWPKFGRTSARLYLSKRDGMMTASLMVEMKGLRPAKAVMRGSKVSAAFPVAEATTPQIIVPTSKVLLSVAGQDLIFNVPTEQLFATALQWTQRGYKEA